MITEINMTCRVNEDEDFDFLVTSHETHDNSITIHGNGLDAMIYCNPSQAKNLISELQFALIRIETHQQDHAEME